MKWRYNSQALGDLRRLAAYYELARRRYGEVFSDRVNEFIERILLNPQLYAEVKRAPRGRNVREGTLEQFETVVTYEVRAEEIVILAITDGRRNRRPWRSRLSET